MTTRSRPMMIAMLFTGYVLVYIDKTVMGFALLPIEKEFGLSTTQLGYITGIFFLAYSLFQIPAGWLNDRFGYRAMTFLSLCLLGLFAICFGLMGFSLGLLIVFRFLSGVGHSGYPCSCAKAVTENFAVEQRTFAQSILLSSSGLAMTVGPVITVAVLNMAGWRHAFIGLGLLVIVVAALILLILPRQHSSASQQRAAMPWSEIIKNPLVIMLFIAIFCINIPTYGLLAWLPKFLVQQREIPVHISGLIVGAGGLGIWISSLTTGWLVGRYMQGHEHRVISLSALLSAAGIWLVYVSENAWVIGLSLFFADIFLMAAFVTVFTLPMKRLPQQVMGATIGLVNTGGTLGGFVAPIVMGYLLALTGDYSAVFLFLAGAMLLAGLVILPAAAYRVQPQAH
ncbi:MFS transporter [Pantoea sp. LMR881]|uniref:MFS transporter n=1 Tax=Pantoea sp. LMR881 TaxID=3014336 RepID=UPI0022B03E77|nr:MFS transporter [Pantoea sp. LMR881]MCZ4059988.1 MFS transporter [Pantoea sp. LMR881]